MNKENLRERIKEFLEKISEPEWEQQKLSPVSIMQITDYFMSLLSQSESKETDSNEVKELTKFLCQINIGAGAIPNFWLSKDIGDKLAKAILKAGYTKNKGELLGYDDCMEVNLDYIEDKQGAYQPTGRFSLDWPGENTTFDTKEQALAWCKKHNFKVVTFGEFKDGKYKITEVE